MSRAILCSALLLSFACSSSEGGAPDVTGGATGSAGSVGQGGGVVAGGAPSAGAGPNAGNGGTPVGSDAGSSGGPVAGSAGSDGTSIAGAGGAAGSGASAGAAGMVSAGGAAGSAGTGPGTSGSVTQRGGDSARTAHWVAPSLTKANAPKMALDTAFKATFAGEFAGTPLFLAGATAGAGRFFAATTENDVYALDETSGAPVWKHNIGGYRANAPTCGGKPNHHGIVSTPVIDAAAHVIYVAASMSDNHHEIHALSTDTGAEVAGFPVDVSKIKSGNLQFLPTYQNQRSALSLVNGIVYVAFGGYCGDAGDYHGWVVGVNTKDPTKVGGWATMDRQAAIWASGGLASDGNGVFAVTGNTASATGTNHATTDSEELIRITDLGTPHPDDVNMFFPSEWSTPMNSSDKDFGSSSPAVITVPNSTPSSVIVAPSKPGRVYFLDATHLGGSKGQFAEVVVADTGAQSVYTAPSAYQGASGVYVALTTGVGSACPGGGNANVMSILMQPGISPDKPPMPKIAWCAKVSLGDTTMRSPISTNSSGKADPIVWMMNGDKLNGFDGDTGALLYDSGSAVCSGIQKFIAPIAVNGRIVTGGTSGGQSHLCSWSVH